MANNPKVGEYRLIIRSLEGSEEETLAKGPLNEQLFDLAWSPDGKTIVSPVSQPGEALSRPRCYRGREWQAQLIRDLE